jgi:tetratricopeptide (TPR) repeat protein
VRLARRRAGDTYDFGRAAREARGPVQVQAWINQPPLASFFNTNVISADSRGDLIGIAHTSSNVSILHYREGHYAAARRWRLRAMTLLARYGLDFERAYLLRQTGALLCQHGRRRRGLEFLEQALDINRSIPSAKFGAQLTRRTIRQYRKSVT